MRSALFLACLLLALLGNAQSPSRDSAYYALLKDSQKIYSSHLTLRDTLPYNQ
ncbi:MAG: hypothetical protein J0H07_05680 [Sphingobacteriales bacterium]|nr:hypothetical protein [Sphingobacteriales bacterium]